MNEDEEGFEYPVIDESRCVRCYQCVKVCPFKVKEQHYRKDRPICFFCELFIQIEMEKSQEILSQCYDRKIQTESSAARFYGSCGGCLWFL